MSLSGVKLTGTQWNACLHLPAARLAWLPGLRGPEWKDPVSVLGREGVECACLDVPERSEGILEGVREVMRPGEASTRFWASTRKA